MNANFKNFKFSKTSFVKVLIFSIFHVSKNLFIHFYLLNNLYVKQLNIVKLNSINTLQEQL